MFKLFTGVIGLIGALWLLFAGIIGAEWWERRPAGQPTWANAHFLWFKWSPPLSLAAQRDQARADFATERASVLVLRKAFDVENGSILTLQTTSDRWQEVSRQAVIRAAAANAWRLSTAARIMALPEPADGSELGQCRAAYGVLKDTGQ